MLQTNQILTSSIRAELYPFQVEKITRQVNDFILSNKESEECSFEICPKCRAVHPRLTKAGLEIRKNYGRLVSLQDGFKAVRRARRDGTPEPELMSVQQDGPADKDKR